MQVQIASSEIKGQKCLECQTIKSDSIYYQMKSCSHIICHNCFYYLSKRLALGKPFQCTRQDCRQVNSESPVWEKQVCKNYKILENAFQLFQTCVKTAKFNACLVHLNKFQDHICVFNECTKKRINCSICIGIDHLECNQKSILDAGFLFENLKFNSYNCQSELKVFLSVLFEKGFKVSNHQRLLDLMADLSRELAKLSFDFFKSEKKDLQFGFETETEIIIIQFGIIDQFAKFFTENIKVIRDLNGLALDQAQELFNKLLVIVRNHPEYDSDEFKLVKIMNSHVSAKMDGSEFEKYMNPINGNVQSNESKLASSCHSDKFTSNCCVCDGGLKLPIGQFSSLLKTECENLVKGQLEQEKSDQLSETTKLVGVKLVLDKNQVKVEMEEVVSKKVFDTVTYNLQMAIQQLQADLSCLRTPGIFGSISKNNFN